MLVHRTPGSASTRQEVPSRTARVTLAFVEDDDCGKAVDSSLLYSWTVAGTTLSLNGTIGADSDDVAVQEVGRSGTTFLLGLANNNNPSGRH